MSISMGSSSLAASKREIAAIRLWWALLSRDFAWLHAASAVSETVVQFSSSASCALSPPSRRRTADSTRPCEAPIPRYCGRPRLVASPPWRPKLLPVFRVRTDHARHRPHEPGLVGPEFSQFLSRTAHPSSSGFCDSSSSSVRIAWQAA